MPESSEQLDLVVLDVLPWAPAVPLLTATQVVVDGSAVEGQPSGKAGENADEGGAVGLPCGRKA